MRPHTSESLPVEGGVDDPTEAQDILERHPIELPSYRLDRVHVAVLNVDYAPPHGNGYARPLSQGRLARLRQDWDPFACSPLVVNRRKTGDLFVIDGNHRRVIAFEKSMLQLPAQVFSGLDRAREADLYTKLGTVFGQTPATRFQAKLVAGDPNAQAIVEVLERYGLRMSTIAPSTGSRAAGEIKAVARVEYIYARGGEPGLDWTMALLTSAYPEDVRGLQEMPLEGAFGFWQRYAALVDLATLAEVLRGAGLSALEDRADSTWAKIDLGPRANTYGHAMAEIWQASHRTRRLPRWERLSTPSDTVMGYQERGLFISFRGPYYRPAENPAPQHLSRDSA